MTTLRPMKPFDLDGVDLNTLEFPLYSTPKIDGMRCWAMDGAAKTSSLSDFPNKAIQEFFASNKWHGMDGELTVGLPYKTGDGTTVLGRTSSGAKSIEGSPDFHFWVFDEWQYPGSAYLTRYERLRHGRPGSQHVHILEHQKLMNVEDLLRMEEQYLAQGYEGIMVRNPLRPYKYGRSTFSEMGLAKLKRFKDGEGIVTSIVEAVSNDNAPTTNAIGKTERRGGKAATTPKGMLGSMLITDLATGESMTLGAGTMTHDERTFYFNNPKKLIGQTVHWRAFGYDIKDKLRVALYYGLRENGD